MKDDILGNDLVYVRDDLAVEPLINRWYAWSHLLSPATLALNIEKRHLSIMNSYIQYPMIHANAVKNPAMLGGPFIDYDGGRVDEVESLKNRTLHSCAKMLELSSDIGKLNLILNKEAKGYSLDSIYSKVPESLKGLVELYYDVNNTPAFRFFEALLYSSKFYDESFQSINLLRVVNDSSRSFVLSTPRLTSPNLLSRNYKFNDNRIDQLFQSSKDPIRYGVIKELFQIIPEEERLFKSFFTRERFPSYKRYRGEGALVRYFGHACILIETKKISILLDPLISYSYDSDVLRFTFENLPEEIDYLLITHNHQDHVLFETLLRIRHKIGCVLVPRNNGGELQDPSLKLIMQKLGFSKVIEIDDMETIQFEDCSITGIPFLGEHCDLNVRSKSCFLVNFNGKVKMLFAADSCNQEPRLYERVHNVVGNIDVIFLGMECDGAPLSWLYGPLLPQPIEREKDQTRRLAGSNFEEAKALIDMFHPREVFVYAMGLEPWLKFISSIKYTEQSRPILESDKLIDYCGTTGIVAQRLFGEKILEYFGRD